MFATGRVLIVTIYFVSSVVGDKKVCSMYNDECVTEGAARKYLEFVEGQDRVNTSDPIYLNSVEVDQPSLKYNINGTLYGMRNCHVEFTEFLPRDMMYIYHVECPHLVLEINYEVKGTLGAERIEETGRFKSHIFDHCFLFRGEYGEFTGKDRKLHLRIINHILEHADMNNGCKNYFNGDHEKSDALQTDENWLFLHKLIRQQALEAFMDIYL